MWYTYHFALCGTCTAENRHRLRIIQPCIDNFLQGKAVEATKQKEEKRKKPKPEE
jgi:hypothetical protein